MQEKAKRRAIEAVSEGATCNLQAKSERSQKEGAKEGKQENLEAEARSCTLPQRQHKHQTQSKGTKSADTSLFFRYCDFSNYLALCFGLTFSTLLETGLGGCSWYCRCRYVSVYLIRYHTLCHGFCCCCHSSLVTSHPEVL